VLHKSLIALAVAIPLTVSACGGGDDTSDTSAATTAESTSTETSTTAAGGGGGAGGTVDISETEYKLDPSDPTVSAGKVTFNLTNDGGTTHNLEVEGDGVEEESDDIQPGQSTSLSVDLKPGSYEIYCAIDGHKDLGMEGTLTVQ
jgi:uncharacterized cupredoxin-like copper-binding protein